MVAMNLLLTCSYLGLGLVVSLDESHKLGHAVAVEVGRAKRVLVHRPAGREDDKVHERPAFNARGAGQHGEDGGVL